MCDKVDKMLHEGMNEKKEDEWKQEIEKYFDGKALRVSYDNDGGKRILHIPREGEENKPLCGSGGESGSLTPVIIQGIGPKYVIDANTSPS